MEASTQVRNKPAYPPWIKVTAACGGFFCIIKSRQLYGEISSPHNVIASINKQNFTRDGTCKMTAKEESCIPNFALLNTAT
jgi:hypothetical protein